MQSGQRKKKQNISQGIDVSHSQFRGWADGLSGFPGPRQRPRGRRALIEGV